MRSEVGGLWGKAAGVWSWPLASILCRGYEGVEPYPCAS